MECLSVIICVCLGLFRASCGKAEGPSFARPGIASLPKEFLNRTTLLEIVNYISPIS